MYNEVIGFSLGNNTSACVVSGENGLEFAISEERLLNEKNTKKFPINAIKECFRHIREKAIHDFMGDGLLIMVSSYEIINERTYKYIPDLQITDIMQNDAYGTIKKYIARHLKLDPNLITLRRVEHHEAHRLPAVYLSGFLQDKDADLIAITYDGFGDGLCATIQNYTTREMLARVELKHSLALVYQFVTGALGFKEHQHEGKITGLAAFGIPKYSGIFEEHLISFDFHIKDFVSRYREDFGIDYNNFNTNIKDFTGFLSLRTATYNLVKFMQDELDASREDIAASLQKYVELQLAYWISSALKSVDIRKANIALSGGLFANVKINKEISDIFRPKNLFIVPPMGDEGTSVGAGIKGLINTNGEDCLSLKAFSDDIMYYGKLDGQLDYEDIIDQYGVKMELEGYALVPHNDDSKRIDHIVRLLADEKVVCLSIGDSEFGPRALGNHTILYDAGLKDTNNWLNERLNRTEFMPFAPIVVDKFKNDLFRNTTGLDKTLKYMTIAVDGTDEFVRDYKAACHVDNTARPQILSCEDNPFTYEILKRYFVLTGKKALINTSYNLHNYPIIANDKVAIESFLQAGLDALCLDNAMIVKVGV